MKQKPISRKTVIKLAVVGCIVLLGFYAQLTGLLDTNEILEYARGYSDNWWLALVLILAQVVLYTFALAGSYALWIVAPIYSPLISTLIMVTGGLAGAIAAYLFSSYLSEEWVERVERSRAYRMLKKHNNLSTCFALRIMPGFPHGLINYSSGVLKTPLDRFLVASVLGLTLKYYVYSTLIHSATTSMSADQAVDITGIWPLVALSLFILAGLTVRSRLENRNAGGQ